MKILKQLVLVALVAGCSPEAVKGTDYVALNYPGMSGTRHKLAGEVWNIADNPKISKMLIRPTIGTAMNEGERRRLNPGSETRLDKDEDFRPAAAQYLANKGCKITGGRLVLEPTYEFDYTC